MSKKRIILQPVIIKGFMGEPTVLKSINKNRLFVTVLGKSGKTQIKLRVKYIYRYVKKVFQQLKRAFNSKNIKRLAKEWQKAKPIIST